MLPNNRFFIPTAIILTIFLLLTAGFLLISSNKYHKDVPLSNERELKVNLDAGFGTVRISHCGSPTLFDASADLDRNYDLSDCLDYSIRDGIGYLNINTGGEVEERPKEKKKKGGFHMGGLESSTWNFQFTDAVPISFDIQLGLGKGVFDMTGLSIKDLNLSTGASSVYLRFDQPNQSTIEDMTIEAGLSKFQADGLSNANFNHLKFEGGVGSYSLDFGGKLSKEVDVDIEVGLGSLTITIPSEIGAKIMYEKNWIAHIDIGRDFTEQEENNYFSSNYKTARGKMNMRIEAGLGTVKIKRE